MYAYLKLYINRDVTFIGNKIISFRCTRSLAHRQKSEIMILKMHFYTTGIVLTV